MKKSRAYRTTRVKNVDWDRILQGREGQACWVGTDVSKDDVRAVLRWPDGEFERPWLVANPQEVGLWSAILARLSKERALTVALEPSGTYGDAPAAGQSRVRLDVRRPKQRHAAWACYGSFPKGPCP